MEKFILIGGVPTVGKTFLAKKISKEIGVPWISTDTIRAFMREVVDKKKYPNLFHFIGKKPDIYLPSHTPKQIVKNQNRESIDVWKGVKSFIKSSYDYASYTPYIIEGVAILPSFVFKDFSKKNYIKPIFLLNSDRNKIKEIIYRRGLWDDAHTYSDNLKEKEVEWVVIFNEWLRKEAKKYKYPTIEISKMEKTSIGIKKYLIKNKII